MRWVWPIFDHADNEVGVVDFWGLLAFLLYGPEDLCVGLFIPRYEEDDE